MSKPLGLRNPGSLCFINCVVQAIASCPSLIAHLEHIQPTSELARRLIALLHEIRPDRYGKESDFTNKSKRKNNQPSAEHLIGHLAWLNSDFANIHSQQDAQELLVYLIKILGEEVRGAVSLHSSLVPQQSDESCSELPSIQLPLKGLVASDVRCKACHGHRPLKLEAFVTVSLSVPVHHQVSASSVPSKTVRSPSIVSKGIAKKSVLTLEDMLRAFVEVEQIDGLNCSSCTAIAVRSKEVSEKAVNHEMSTEEEAVQRMIRISFAKGKNDSFSCMLDIAEEIKHLQRDHYVDPTFLKSLPAPSQPLATSPSSDNDDSDKVMAASGIMTEEDKLAPTLTIQSLYTQNSRAVIKQTVGDNQRYDDGESTSSVNWTNSNANYDSTSIDAHWPLLRSIISGSSSSSCGTVYEYVLKHRQQATVAKRTFFARLPSILCLHIIRRVPDMFTGKMKKLSQRIQFPLVLDMAPFCGSSGYKNASSGSQNHQSVRSSTYDLCSVVQHLGGEGSGHYVTYGRQDNGSWMFFSDKDVRVAKQSEALNAEAYLLFYLRRS